LRVWRGVFLARKVHSRVQHAGCVEAGVDAGLRARTFHQHAGAAKQHQRERDFSSD
jgi:hypothetical protein